MKDKKEKDQSVYTKCTRDNTGVTALVSNEIDIDSIRLPRHRSKSQPQPQRIKIIDSSGKNVVSAVRNEKE